MTEELAIGELTVPLSSLSPEVQKTHLSRDPKFLAGVALMREKRERETAIELLRKLVETDWQKIMRHHSKTAIELLRKLIEADPCPDGKGPEYCIHCGGYWVEPDRTECVHWDTCPWVQAKAFLDSLK